MKTIVAKIGEGVAVVSGIKKKTDLLIVRLTNMKSYATLESFIISMSR